ncbi:MAG: Rne/Rng family ribonuclease [Rhodospirillaceae bacterium]|jgi:ribonuclease G|nr:Rne/Rng family ribonuclease [Rhodospirillales bacterium]MBT3906140.1 Rne/Rng family ribonuclease [Rhodospirillaceae bacterium]MBT4703534.1 Rne/Rng family ribonuclease [Rhodospirillaceae bacterium]MBT5033570.1 Rne/Rng family ribonuclease [Rhodospirillaceae bacterium]MBT6218387.1 Rne/Rng family ribonuclease [Rhodospirillaceae bacterium]
MTDDVILINSQLGESRIAVLEDARLTDIIIRRSKTAGIVGNIYLGRVEKVLTGLQAAFIDIGLGRSGFLGLADARLVAKQNNDADDSIADYVKEGDAVPVQVTREAFEDKGAKLSLKISLPGHYMVFAPGQATVKVSRRLGDEGERKRLQGVLSDLSDEADGVIARTAAEGASDQALAKDLSHLQSLWKQISDQRTTARPPLLMLDQAGSIYRVLVDLGGLSADRIVVDDAGVLAEIKREAGTGSGLEKNLTLHTGDEELFEAHGVEEQLDAALSGTVALPSGGTILIDETRALTAIDVNTGGARFGSPEETAFQTNLEAADVLAREIRLRNLSGLLIVDAVPLRAEKNRTKFLARLREAVARDPVPMHVVGFTKLGLVEMTRERRRPSLSTVVCGDLLNERAKSTLSLTFDALRRVGRESHAHPGRALALTAAPLVINMLRGDASQALAATDEKLGRPLVLEADPTLATSEFHVRPLV